jgi:DNA-binding transcriptional LysR family regulator
LGDCHPCPRHDSHFSDDLLSDRIVSVMPEFKPRSTELWLICPSRQSITPAVRLLRDMFRKKTSRILNRLTDNGILEPIEEKT